MPIQLENIESKLGSRFPNACKDALDMAVKTIYEIATKYHNGNPPKEVPVDVVNSLLHDEQLHKSGTDYTDHGGRVGGKIG